jgi:hypothetical protein
MSNALALIFTVAGILTFSPEPAGANAILIGTTGDAIGIAGLAVDGTLYDVTFIHESYDNVYASTAPTFVGNPTDGNHAATALSAALNFLGVTKLDGGVTEAAIPDTFNLTGDCFGVAAPCFSGYSTDLTGTIWSVATVAAESDLVFVVDQAVFTSVPGPAAGAGFPGLVVAAAGLLAWWRRRKVMAGRSRLDRDVLGNKPDLLIWQIGTE